MQAGKICQRLVFTIEANDEVTHAAQLMREKHVGYLVVAEPDLVGQCVRPVGVLTDRDIVITVVAREVDPKTLKVRDIMTPNPVTIDEAESMETALQKMREFGIRRLPVIDRNGALMGILAADDILCVLAADTEDMVTAARTQRRVEGARRT